MQESVLKKFDITRDGMEEVAAALRGEFDEGLSRSDHTSSVKMLITFVHSLPNGSKEEEGDFLALDLGGTNLRVLLVKIKEGKDTQTAVKKSVLTEELITGTQEVLFDHIATEVASFVKEQNIETALPLGFTFSFPVKQSSLTSGQRREGLTQVVLCPRIVCMSRGGGGRVWSLSVRVGREGLAGWTVSRVDQLLY